MRARAREGRVSSEACLPGGPLAASVHRLYDVTGDSPIRLGRSARFIDGAPEIVWWRLLGVRYVVSKRSWPVAAPVAPLARSAEAGLYEVQLPVPPTWVPQRWSWAAAGWLPAADFDPLQEAVLLEAPPNFAWREVQLDPSEDQVRGTSQLIALDNNRAVVKAQLDQPGLVVWSSVYAPGWRAVARSASGEVRRPVVGVAYGMLSAVFLPAGSWIVEWSYWPPGLSLALVFLALGLLSGGVLWRKSARVT